jgi:hypothetical protein
MTQNRTAAEIINGEKPQTVNSFAGNPSNPIDDQVDALDMGTTVIPQLPFPVTVPFDNQYHDFYSGEVLNPTIKENPQTVGKFESIGQGFAAMNDFSLMANNQNLDNPLYESVPPNWKPSDEIDNLAGIPEIYSGYILAATGPKDSRRRYFNVLDMMRNDERYENGSMFGHAVGLLLGGVVSPSTWIPIGTEVKAASLSTRMLQDIPKVLPGITASAAAHEAVVETNRAGGNLQDFATNTLRDTVMGIAFMGTAMGLGHGYTAGKLWDAKRYINLTGKDIDIVPLLAEDGSILKFEAKSKSAGAAELSFAQDYANSRMAQEGLFGVPVIGGLVGKGAATINPIIRGLNSRFDGVRAFWNGAADHGIATERNAGGVASPEKFEVKMGMLQGDNKQVMNVLNGMFLERNGIDPSKRMVAGLQDLRKKWQDTDYVSKEKFMDEIEGVLINEVPHENATVNEAAGLLREKMDTTWAEFRKAYDLPESWLPPKTARGFLSRVYDLNYLKQNENKWMETVVPWMTESDEMISSKMQPISDLENELKQANISLDAITFDKNALKRDVEQAKNKVKELATNLKLEKMILENELRNNESYRIHLADNWRTAVSSDEAEKISGIKKPIDDGKRQVDLLTRKIENQNNVIKKAEKAILKHQKVIKRVKDEIPEDRIKRERYNETIRKNIELRDEAIAEHTKAKKEIEKLTAEHRKLEKNVDDLEQMLYEDMYSGKIDANLYYKDSDGKFVLKDPDNRLKFRPTYESKFHIEQAAKAYYNSIMRQSAEETTAQVMESLSGQAGTNPTKARAILLPDQLMYDNNFLSKELGVNVANYRNFLGRRTFLKNIYRDVSIEGGPEELIANVAKQFEAEKQVLNKKKAVYEAKEKEGKLSKKDEKAVKEINKQLYQLDKAFNSDVQDMTLAYAKMMGKTQGSEALRRNTAILRSFAVAVKMGATPLTMVTDLMAIPMKHGIWPFISEGLLPVLKGAFHQVKGSKDPNAMQNAGHANLALNHVLSGFTDRNYAGSAQPYAPMGDSLVNGMERMAHLANNLAGTNQIENFFQQITASVVQSKVMRYLMDYKAGTLSDKNLQKLLVYGIDPEKWADRMIAGWKAAGSDENKLGGYQSWFWKWADHEASNKMADVVYRGTKDTIIRRGMFDAPFAMDDPILGTMFMFKGWAMASMTRYLAPLLQRPDSEKLIGTVLMLSAGAMVTPLRRLVKGEEPFEDDDNMFWNAAVDGGVFSSITDTLETVNVLMGGALLKDVKNDRYKNRTISGMLGGPIAGMGEDIAHIIRMMASGNYNQTDVNKMARLIPFAQTWYLRGLSNKMVESMNIPKTYGQAEARNR